MILSFWDGLFSVAFAVSFRESKCFVTHKKVAAMDAWSRVHLWNWLLFRSANLKRWDFGWVLCLEWRRTQIYKAPTPWGLQGLHCEHPLQCLLACLHVVETTGFQDFQHLKSHCWLVFGNFGRKCWEIALGKVKLRWFGDGKNRVLTWEWENRITNENHKSEISCFKTTCSQTSWTSPRESCQNTASQWIPWRLIGVCSPPPRVCGKWGSHLLGGPWNSKKNKIPWIQNK